MPRRVGRHRNYRKHKIDQKERHEGLEVEEVAEVEQAGWEVEKAKEKLVGQVGLDMETVVERVAGATVEVETEEVG